MNLVQPSLYLLAGFCTYAAIQHTLNALHGGDRRLHGLVAGLCFAAAVAGMSQAVLVQAHETATFVAALRWNLHGAAIAYLLLPWFIAEYTGSGPRPLLWGLSAVFVLLGAVNLVSPLTAQYSAITELRGVALPWGESWTQVSGRINPWFQLATAGLLGVIAYALYALWHLRGQRGGYWVMGSVLVFLFATLQGVLVRQGRIDFIPLGSYGFLVMVLGMSMAVQSRWRQTQHNNQAVLDQLPSLVYLRDLRGRFHLANERYALMNNTDTRALPGRTLYDIWPRAVADELRAKDHEVVARGQAIEFEEVLLHHGEPRTYITQRFPLARADGEIVAVGGISTDITDRKRLEDALRDIALASSDSFGDTYLHRLTEQLVRLFKADHAFVAVIEPGLVPTARTLARHSHGAPAPNFSYALAGSPCAGVLSGPTCVYSHGVQGLFPADTGLRNMGVESYVGTRLLDARGEAIGLIAVLHGKPLAPGRLVIDILEIMAARTSAEMLRVRAEQHIRRLAHEDYLTGLASRPLLHETLRAHVAAARSQDAQGAALVIDLDHFKTINDALGHELGDQVLREVARRLSGVAGPGVLLARHGSDEFVAVLPPQGARTVEQVRAQAQALADAALESLHPPVCCGPQVLNIGASIGVALFPEGDDSELDVLRRADMALSRAKAGGRKAVVFYQADMMTSATERLRLEKGLHEALEQHQFHLCYQPQVDTDGRPVGVEALLRWQHPQMGAVPPDRFIRIAEETGLIQPIGQWVLNEALRQAQAWRRAGVAFGGQVSVNVSAWQFAREDFHDLVLHALAESGVPPSTLTLELTESALLYDVRATITKLARLRETGVQVSLDDFGTGYSSLAYLRDLPLDELKIDRAFVQELGREGGRPPLVGAMVAIGHQMGLRVVAEGVETETQRLALAALGCNAFQGYLFARPLGESGLRSWCASAPPARGISL